MIDDTVFFDECDRPWIEDWDDEEYERQTNAWYEIDEFDQWRELMLDRDMADCD